MIDIDDVLRRGAPAADAAAAKAAAERAASVAAERGAAVIAYAIEPSPLGDLLIAKGARGVLRVAYVRSGPVATALAPTDEVLASLAARISPAIVEAPARLDDVRRELDEYFAGDRTGFDIAVDLSLVRGPFGRRVLEQTALIPFGGHASYADMATRAGSPRAVRAAGNALGANPIPIIVPCHRVLRSGGGLGGYTGGLDIKRHLLALERGERPLEV